MKGEIFSVDKENTFKGKLTREVIAWVVAPLFRLIWLKGISGKQNLPKTGPFIIAANHQSFFDFLLLICLFPRMQIHFLAAEKFYSSKLWRPLMQYTGQIRVERFGNGNKKEVFEKGIAVLQNSRVLAIFPQGTRSRNGKIEKVYSGVGRFALQTGAPVVPVGIRGAFQTWPPHQKRPLFKKQVSLHFGKPLRFEKAQDIKEVPSQKCRQITDEVMEKIAILSQKSYQKETN